MFNPEGLIPAVSPLPPAPLAEHVALVVSPADTSTAAVGIKVADAVGANTAAAAVTRIAATLATRGVLFAGLPVPAAATGSGFPVPAAAIIAISLVAPPSAIAADTSFRAALGVLAATFSRKAAPFDENVVFLRQAQIRPSERHQCYSGSRHFLQSRTPALKFSEHPRPVVEPAVIHGVPLLPQL